MNVCIIGVGLIGGSIALKLKKKKLAERIFGVDFNNKNCIYALEMNIIDQAVQLEEGIKNADLILLAIPVDAAQKILPSLLDKINKKQTVLDVGSTKYNIIKAVENHPNRDRFVAFHPMWGTENSGPTSATEDSFTGKVGVICNPEDSAEDALEVIKKVIMALDMHLVYMDAVDHDVHTAYISHISHITSYALANTVLEKEKEEETIFQLASSGFSSTVRLAKSHPEMWVPIFKQNRENVLDVLNEHIHQLNKFKWALENKDDEALTQLITKANKIKQILAEK